MKTNQAIDFLETLAASHIAPREMSKAMFTIVRAAARCAQRDYPGMAGYYDPESDAVRANPAQYEFRRAMPEAVIPQSPALRQRITDRTIDQFAVTMAMFA